MGQHTPEPPIRASGVEYITCPKCGEVAVLERDDDNMTIVPTACPCGQSLGLRQLLGQMKSAADRPVPTPGAGGEKE